MHTSYLLGWSKLLHVSCPYNKIPNVPDCAILIIVHFLFHLVLPLHSFGALDLAPFLPACPAQSFPSPSLARSSFPYIPHPNLSHHLPLICPEMSMKVCDCPEFAVGPSLHPSRAMPLKESTCTAEDTLADFPLGCVARARLERLLP